MREFPNFIEKSLGKEKEFVKQLEQASEKFFDSLTESVFTKKDRQLKFWRNEANTRYYLFDKTPKSIHVYTEEIYDFKQEDSTKALLKYTLAGLKENNTIYLPLVVGIFKTGEKDFTKRSNQELFESMIELDPNAKEVVDTLKTLFKKELQDPYYLFNKEMQNLSATKCSSDVSLLKDYAELLHSKGFLPHTYSESFFKDMNQGLNPMVDKMLDDMRDTIIFMMEVCKENKLNTYQSAFDYNDSDNNIWMKDNHLVLSDQTCGYYVHFQDKDNFTIYFLDKEYRGVEDEIRRLDTALQQGALYTLRDVALEVKDGKTTWANGLWVSILELNLEYGYKALKEAGWANANIRWISSLMPTSVTTTTANTA